MPAESQRLNSDSAEDRLPVTRILRMAGEAVLYFILVISPWAFGGVDPEWQFVIAAAVGVLTILWLARCVFYRRVTIRPDGVTLALGGLLCLTAFQLIPLPIGIVSILSPVRANEYRALVPESLERIGSEQVAEGRPTSIPLTVDAELTRHFLADVLIVLFVYVIARNWLASRRSFRRLAIVAAVNGVALALFAFAQMWMSGGKMFWTIPASQASFFGPFVCRNHYPFYAYVCLGALVGLLVNQAKSEYSTVTGTGLVRAYQSVIAWFGNVTQSAWAVLLLIGAMIVAVSIPFSLSRGGLLTLVAAGLFAGAVAAAVVGKRVGGSVLAVGVVVSCALALGTWVGWGPVEKRIQGTIADGAASDNRSELWQSALQIALRYPVFGAGANGFQRVEPATRVPGSVTATNSYTIVNDSVHNEYLEALAEGGLVRFALTGLLVVSAIGASIRAYRRLHSRSAGSVALGLSFGLFAIAFHSVFDFGIHIPAIALLAATVAGYVQAAATDSEFHPSKRMKSNSSNTVRTEEINEDNRQPRVASMSLIGPPALAACAVVLIGLGLVVRQYRIWDRGERYGAAAEAVRNANPENFEPRIALLAARCGLEPGNAEAQTALARAHFDAAIASRNRKPGAGQSLDIPPEVKDRHIVPALVACRAARAASPHYPVPHMRFALYRKYFESTDPARTYFERVTRLVPCDAEAWYASGVEAFGHGDIGTAFRDWKQSLTLGGRRQLVPILELAATKVDVRNDEVERVFRELLPGDPTVLLAAVNWLFPDRTSQKAARKPYMQRVRDAVDQLPRKTAASFVALAQVEFELERIDAALAAWKRAVELAPGDIGLRHEYAKWLDEEEYYELLVTELEWLRANNAGGYNIIDRLDAARHAVDLNHRLSK
jgi:tetratricopeptide (TPR) repeat protein